MSMANTNIKKRLVVLAILLIFLSPVLLSWWLLKHTDFSRGEAAASHGSLVVPPRPLRDVALVSMNDPSRQQRLHGKWSMLYLHDGACRKTCVDNLYKMRQIRLATGKYAPRIQRVILLGSAAPARFSEEQKQQFAGQLILRVKNSEQLAALKAFRLVDDEDPKTKQRLYIVDPLGNLMMSYPPDADPGGIIKDLNRLLRYSRIG